MSDAERATQTRGILLALVTVACWSILPVTLRIASRQLDPYTLTWYRFFLSALVLGGILAWRRQLPPASALGARWPLALLLGATLGLLGNYVLYLISLDYVSPTAGAVITQLAPFLLMFGGVWLFRERLSRKQIVGVVLLIAGLLLFFNRRLGEFAGLTGREGAGTLILLAASVVWAVYGLAQKALLRHFSANQILLLIYAGATIALVAFSAPFSVRALGTLELTMLGLSAANTLVAYGALAVALENAGAATVGAVLAVGPVATLVVTWLSNKMSPGFFPPDDLNAATIAGAVVVTIGSAMSARK